VPKYVVINMYQGGSVEKGKWGRKTRVDCQYLVRKKVELVSFCCYLLLYLCWHMNCTNLSSFIYACIFNNVATVCLPFPFPLFVSFWRLLQLPEVPLGD